MICLEILWEVKSGDKSSKRWTAFGKFFSVSENIEDLGVPRLRIFETIQYSSPGEVGREILRVTWFSGREKGGVSLHQQSIEKGLKKANCQVTAN